MRSAGSDGHIVDMALMMVQVCHSVVLKKESIMCLVFHFLRFCYSASDINDCRNTVQRVKKGLREPIECLALLPRAPGSHGEP